MDRNGNEDGRRAGSGSPQKQSGRFVPLISPVSHFRTCLMPFYEPVSSAVWALGFRASMNDLSEQEHRKSDISTGFLNPER